MGEGVIMFTEEVDGKQMVVRPKGRKRLIEAILKSGKTILFDGTYTHVRGDMMFFLEAPIRVENHPRPICHIVGAVPVNDIELVHVVEDPRDDEEEVHPDSKPPERASCDEGGEA
jgi:hypothetical protein